MRTLVIGGAGQDGVLISAQLLERGADVISVSRRPSPLLAVESQVADVAGAGVAADLCERYKPDAVYYLAAYHRSSEIVDPDPAEDLCGCLDVNAVAFSKVLGSVSKHCPKARVVYASSCRIFGLGDGHLLQGSEPRAPICAYGISKVAGMGAGDLFRREHGVFVSSAILFNHESELRTSNFVSKKLALAAVRAKQDPDTLVEVGSLDAVADWGSARDYCRAMTAMAEADAPGDFIVASGQLRTVAEFAEECFKCVGRDWRQHVKEKSGVLHGNVWRLRGDSGALTKATGWKPKFSFPEMVRDLVTRTEAQASDGKGPADFHSYL